MRVIQTSFSLNYFIEDLVYTEALLSANPLTTNLSEPLRNLIGKSEEIQTNLKKARIEHTRKRALLAYADYVMDDLVKNFSLELLTVCKGDRSNELYKKYFKIRPSLTAKLPIIEEIIEIERIVSELNRESVTELASYKSKFEEAKENLKRAFASEKEAKIVYQNKVEDVISLKNDINRLRMGIYAELLSIALEQKLGKEFAERFFKQADTRDKEEEEESKQGEEVPVTG